MEFVFTRILDAYRKRRIIQVNSRNMQKLALFEIRLDINTRIYDMNDFPKKIENLPFLPDDLYSRILQGKNKFSGCNCDEKG